MYSEMMTDPSVRAETLNRCPNCGGANHAHWADAHDRLLGLSRRVFAYRSCNDCDVLFQSPRPVEADIGIFYAEAYAPHLGRAPDATHLFLLPGVLNRLCMRLAERVLGMSEFQAKMHQFYKAMAEGGRFLDFGCGAGKFLDRARKSGCQTIGMDFSPNALAEVTRRGHKALAIGPDGWNDIPERSIRMIRMNHVVEHLYDPASVMRHLHDKLAPDGLIHVSTPNPEGLSAREYREHWFSLDCPRHIMLFPPHALTKLMGIAGFREMRVIHEPLAKDMLRSAIYRDMDQSGKTIYHVIDLAGDGARNLRWALACRRGTSSGGGDRYHVLAKKIEDA